jgi:hypothetical protein
MRKRCADMSFEKTGFCDSLAVSVPRPSFCTLSGFRPAKIQQIDKKCLSRNSGPVLRAENTRARQQKGLNGFRPQNKKPCGSVIVPQD